MIALVSIFSFTLGAGICLAEVIRSPTTGKEPSFTTQDFSATVTVIPSSSGDPCGAIADAIGNIDDASEEVVVPAEDAYNCLQVVPIHQGDASVTMNALLRLMQFQSTLSYLKNPPDGYGNAPVDILSGLNDISNKVSQGSYAGELDFETDISNLLDKAFDGHLAFEGWTMSGTFTWKRDKAATLAIASNDNDVPKVWVIGDFNTSATFTPSPVSQIDGTDVNTFLENLSQTRLFHDADARWNSLALLQAADSAGAFITPFLYPGPNTTLTFENGTSRVFENYAIIDDPEYWSDITDAQTFYEVMVGASSSSSDKRKRRDLQRKSKKVAPKKLQMPKNLDARKSGTVPESYPDPVFEHSSPDVGLGGFVISTTSGTVAVLMLQTFDVSSVEDAREWQSELQGFFNEAKSMGAQKIIVDIRDNGGGLILLGEAPILSFPHPLIVLCGVHVSGMLALLITWL